MRPRGAFFWGERQFCPSEKFELLWRWLDLLLRSSFKDLHHPKLLVGNLQDANLPLFREEALHTPLVEISPFPTDRVPYVDRELEHLKPVLQKIVPELRRSLLVGRCGYGEVKKYQIPHHSILIEPGVGDA